MRSYHFRIFRIVAAIFTILVLFFLTSRVTSAAETKSLINCQSNTYTWAHFNVYLWQKTENHECDSTPILQDDYALTYIANCNNIPETVNVDVWQTRATNSSGSRYYGTGRSGWITYPKDCNYYQILPDSVGAQLANPSWACNWEAFNGNGGPAYDYQCQQIPNG